MIVQTSFDGLIEHSARWSDAVVGVAHVHYDGISSALMVAGPVRSPYLVDARDRVLRPDVVAEPSQMAASVPTGRGPCVGGMSLGRAVRFWWSVPLPLPAAGQDAVPFRLAINGEVLAGRARRPPARSVPAEPAETEPKPSARPKRRRLVEARR